MSKKYSLHCQIFFQSNREKKISGMPAKNEPLVFAQPNLIQYLSEGEVDKKIFLLLCYLSLTTQLLIRLKKVQVTCFKGSLSKEGFEQRTPTGSKAFSLLLCLDATKFLSLSVYSYSDKFPPKMWAKPPHKNTKSPLPA